MIRFSRKTNSKAASWAALFFLFFSGFISCKKYEGDIGYDLLPNTNSYSGIVVDTFSVIAKTVKEDSIRVDSLSSSILGAINDPLFGITSANLYTQCLLEEINIDFGTNPTLDSVVLALVMDSDNEAYGNVNSEVRIGVHKMGEILKKEYRYFSDYNPALLEAIGNYQGRLNPADTVYYYEGKNLQKTTGLLRIKLDRTFGESFFHANAYGSNESFLNFLNGIALIPEPGSLSTNQGSIVPIDLNHSDTKLIVYYNDSLTKEFTVSDQAERIMHYDVVSRSGAISSQLAVTNGHFDETYIQSMGSCKTRIFIPGLLDLVKDGNQVVINEAKLTLTIKDGTASDNYPAPERLLLVQPANSNGTGANSLILDLIDQIAPENSGWIGYTNYGGSLNSDGTTYTFHFNRHLQSILDTYLSTGVDGNKGFYILIPSDVPITPSRVVLDTRNNQSVTNIKVKVTYTKL